MNRVTLIGRLGKDPEVRYTPNGKAVGNFSIATDEKWTDKSGQKHEATEWHRIVCWDKQAELCAEYLSKGRQVAIEGRIETREWTNKEGVKQYTTEIVASHVEFLGGKEDGGGSRAKPAAPAAESREEDGPPPVTPDDENIPF
jgi:single-strand DNA-binding protein